MMQHNDNSIGNKIDLAVYRIDTAKENLAAAQALLELEFYKDANDRAYYSVFHSINALLAIEEVGFKRHKDVLAHFNKNYIKDGIFPKEIGRKISKARQIREASDYHDFYITSKTEAEKCISTAAELIPLVEKYIEANTNKY